MNHRNHYFDSEKNTGFLVFFSTRHIIHHVNTYLEKKPVFSNAQIQIPNASVKHTFFQYRLPTNIEYITILEACFYYGKIAQIFSK